MSRRCALHSKAVTTIVALSVVLSRALSHSLFLSRALSVSLSCARALPLFIYLSLFLSLLLSFALSLSRARGLSLSLFLSLSLSQSFSLSLSHTLTLSLSRARSLSLSLSLSRALFSLSFFLSHYHDTEILKLNSGPAADHQCLEAAGTFDPNTWADWQDMLGGEWPKFLYDAGVSAKTKTAFLHACVDLVTSGIVRNSAESELSAAQRTVNFKWSSKRIRVENFIGIVKRRFKVLKNVVALDDLGMMDRLVYTCFMLHNFGPPIIA